MRPKLTAMIGVALVLAVGPVGWAASAEVLLEKGIHQEETVGDLAGAIKIYEEIVADAEANQRYVAEAQYRLGMCRLKNGEKAQGVAALKRVLSDYPRQTSITTKAREELAKLGELGGDEPVVVKTTPEAFADNVPASLKKLTVTFDRPMMDRSWSWTGGDTFPTKTGEPRYDATKTTCSLPVKLEPGKVYWAGINGQTFKAFQTPDRVPAVPYVILFATKGKDGKPTPIPDDLLRKAREINAKVHEAAQGPSRTPPLPLGPVPWKDGEVLQLDMRLQNGLDIGAFICSADAARDNGRDVWEFRVRRYVVSGDNQGSSLAVVDRKTFLPIRSRFLHTMLGNAEAVYHPDEVEITRYAYGKEPSKRTLKLNGAVYDNEQGVHLFRRLSLEVGDTITVPICSPAGSALIEIVLNTVAKETLEVPAGKFECYKVELDIGQTFWYSTDARHLLVQFEAGPVTARLVDVRHRKAGTPSRFEDKDLGITLTAPAGWYFHKHQGTEEHKSETAVHLLDPEARAFSRLVLTPLADLDDEEKASPRALADDVIKEAKSQLKDVKVRENSWRETKVAGRPAVSCIADCVDRERKMVLYCTSALGEKNAIRFVMLTERERFDELRPQFDKIIASLEMR